LLAALLATLLGGFLASLFASATLGSGPLGSLGSLFATFLGSLFATASAASAAAAAFVADFDFLELLKHTFRILIIHCVYLLGELKRCAKFQFIGREWRDPRPNFYPFDWALLTFIRSREKSLSHT